MTADEREAEADTGGDKFPEIEHTGGRITFHVDERGISTEFKHSNNCAASLHQVCVSHEGEILDFVSFGGLGAVVPYPQPSILVLLASDREGMFGHACPRCKSYFRATSAVVQTCCYCGHRNHPVTFITPNQRQYIEKYCNAYIDAYNRQETTEINLDAIVAALSNNKHDWAYSQEKLQSEHKCPCRTTFDILGDYGLCPTCSRPNFSSVFEKKIASMAEEFESTNATLTDRTDREIAWEKLTRCVSEFEALANVARNRLLRLPLTPKRRGDLASLSFQNLENASKLLERWFGFEILANVSNEDRRFLNTMFNRRHVFTHKAGQIDQEYLDSTGDTTVRLNQVIRFRSKEIRRLIPLIKLCSVNFLAGLDAMKSS